MTTDQQLEAVARAIKEVSGGVNYDYMDFCRDAARAAIAALTIPQPKADDAALVERLERLFPDLETGQWELVNPDGPKAAARITALSQPVPSEAVLEKLRRIIRTCEMSMGIMRDRRRTGGWKGAENVARQFNHIATYATEARAMLTAGENSDAS